MTCFDFNKKYRDILEEGERGLSIEEPAVIEYLDEIFADLRKIEGFKYRQIGLWRGIPFTETNLEELIPFVGRIINHEISEKLSFILKVEYEVKRRMENLTEHESK